jgi:hypothetical protein
MGMVEVTPLHSRGIGKLELSPPLEVESSSLGDSLRMACTDSDPLFAMHMNTTTKSFPSGNRPWSSDGSAMNSRPSERMASTLVSLEPNR